MEDIKILVTGVGSGAAQGNCHCFKLVKERNIYIVGTDIQDSVPNLYIDKYYKNKGYNDPDFINSLLDICKKEKINFLFPLVDGELYPIATQRDEFYKIGTIVCLNDADTIKLIQNKYNLYKFLEDKNIDVPKCLLFNNINEFIDGCKKLGFPENDVCYKPVVSSGSRGFRIISNNINIEDYLFKDRPTINTFSYDYAIDLMNKVESFPQMMLMEYLTGEYIEVSCFAIKGEIKKIVAYTLPELSNIGISRLSIKVIINNEIEKYCERLVNVLKLDGFFGIQLMYSKDNILKLIEINPRIQGSSIVTHFVGSNMPYFDIKYHLGEKIDFSKEIKSIKVKTVADYVVVDE